METQPVPDKLTGNVSRLARELRDRIKVLAHAARVRQGEAKVVAYHIQQQAQVRDGSRSRANLVYAFGAIAERVGYTELDDYAIYALEHHGPLYAWWLAEAATESLAWNRGELLRHIFSDARRYDWCRKEGARLAWEYGKAARDLETALFHERQKNKTKHWRKEPMTARQFWMITLISIRGDIPIPGPLRCGPAHDWIARNGGHPNFWEPPLRPPPWQVE